MENIIGFRARQIAKTDTSTATKKAILLQQSVRRLLILLQKSPTLLQISDFRHVGTKEFAQTHFNNILAYSEFLSFGRSNM